MMSYFRLLFFSFLLSPYFVGAQLSFSRIPESFKLKEFDYEMVSFIEKEPINIDELKKEDENWNYSAQRVGVKKNVDVDFTSSASWYDVGGGRIGLMRFKAPNAKASSLFLKDVVLPKGVFFSVYSPDKERVKGAYSSRSLGKGSSVFTHDPILGEELVIEVYEPDEVVGQSSFVVEALNYMYILPESYLKNSGSCNVDVNCSEGNSWETQKKSVVKMQISKGTWTGVCTGVLLNNVLEDCRPLLLSAWHCGLGNGFSDPTPADLNAYLFYFNYERSNCGFGNSLNQTMLGCSMLGNSQDAGGDHGSDFMLVELNDQIPWSFDVYFAGWDATGNSSLGGVGIHHPSGDVKKISTYTAQLTSGSTGSAINSHWVVQWVPTANGYGVTEGGSSGSPIFSINGLVLGQLTGGGASCSNPTATDKYGKLSYSWLSNTNVGGDQLKPLLDPNDSGVLTMGGRYNNCVNSVGENMQEIEIEMYPNPINSHLTVDTKSMENYKFSVFSSDGKIVFESINQLKGKNEFDLSFLTSGMYIVRIKMGPNFVQNKVIVE